MTSYGFSHTTVKQYSTYKMQAHKEAEHGQCQTYLTHPDVQWAHSDLEWIG